MSEGGGAPRGRKQYCPRCREIQTTHAGRPYQVGLDEHRQVKSDTYNDISWFRRVRICSVCGPHFVTAELDEALIEELIQSRERLAQQVKRQIGVVKSKRPWLKTREETIPLDLAKALVRASTWWLTHSSGSPVRAPGHADRIRKTVHGWTVDFGANSFLVGKAIERSRKMILDAMDEIGRGAVVSRSGLTSRLRNAMAWSVANHVLEEYNFYDVKGDDLVFGATSIDVKHAAQFMIRESGIDEYLSDP